MAKEMSEKKEKKSKRSSHAAELVQDAGVTKKSKKHKKSHVSDADTTMLSEAAVEAQTTVALARADGSDDEDGAADITMAGSDEVAVPLVSVLVPFANPLASDDKTKKKVLKGVKRAAKAKALKRGVKEVVKSLRKTTTASSSGTPSLVVLAADISPYDVISHLPVLCEEHDVPYCYVPSRVELGMAGATKRPTSVVMISATAGKGNDGEGWAEGFADVAKVIRKLSASVMV